MGSKGKKGKRRVRSRSMSSSIRRRRRSNSSSPLPQRPNTSRSRSRLRRGPKPEAANPVVFRITPTVRVENLPDDMGEQELIEYGADFGKVIHVKTWSLRGVRSGRLEFENMEDAVEAITQLDGRRVEGWDKKLRAYMPCQASG